MKKSPSIKELNKFAWKFKNRKTETHLRIFSPYFLWALLHTKITPNQLTMFWVLLVIITSPFFLIYNFSIHIIASAIILLCLQLDMVDGSLARYRKQFSKKGAIIDFIGSWLMAILPQTFLAISYFLNTGKSWIIIALSFFLIGFIMKELIPLKEMFIYQKKITDDKPKDKGRLHNIYSFARKLMLIDYSIEMLFISILIGIPEYYILFYAFSYNVYWIARGETVELTSHSIRHINNEV